MVKWPRRRKQGKERERGENARVDAKCCGIPKILERRKHLALPCWWSGAPPPEREREREDTP